MSKLSLLNFRFYTMDGIQAVYVLNMVSFYYFLSLLLLFIFGQKISIDVIISYVLINNRIYKQRVIIALKK